MKAKIPKLVQWTIDLVAYKRILPKNEANHARIGYFETIYFLVWRALIWFGIDSMERALAVQDVYGCYK